jgi:hypothetical protein
MRIRLFLTVLGLSLLAACGGGSSNDGSAEGVWAGTYTNDPSVGPVPLHGIIQNGVMAIFFDNTGLSSVITGFSGTNFSGNGTLYPATGFIFVGNKLTLPLTTHVAVTNGKMTGALTLEGAAAPMNLAPFTHVSGAPAVKEGVWSGQYFGSSSVSINVAADGSIQGNDAFGCHLSGTIKLIDASEDLFSLVLDGTGASFCVHHYKGLAFESTEDQLDLDGHAAGTYYYLAAYDSTAPFLAEVKLQ